MKEFKIIMIKVILISIFSDLVATNAIKDVSPKHETNIVFQHIDKDFVGGLGGVYHTNMRS